MYKTHPDRKHNASIQALIDKGYRFAIIDAESRIITCRRFQVDAVRDSKSLHKVKVVPLTKLMKNV